MNDLMLGEDPIYALASGGTAQRQAIAVIRASGKGVREILESLTHGKLPKPRLASVRLLFDPQNAEKILDQALVLWLPNPNSYTGEDSFELHLHGSRAVIENVFKALSQLGARLAGPGEFTKRAVLNGKIDLLQAEAVADLIEAETDEQAEQALNQLEGGFSQLARQWGADIRKLVAQTEALVDFPEETTPEIMATLRQRIESVRKSVEGLLADQSGELIREGLSVVLIGAPNAGKSTLFNALLKEDYAIVTDIAGTTRDSLSVDWRLDGMKIRLTDTAGLRETDDPIEAEGIKRAKAHLSKAQLVLHLIPADRHGDDETREIARALMAPDARLLTVRTKSDLGQDEIGDEIAISSKLENGLNPLIKLLRDALKNYKPARQSNACVTRHRHRVVLEELVGYLSDAERQDIEVLLCEDLRLALRAIGALTGQVDCETILGDIFGEFCIGK